MELWIVHYSLFNELKIFKTRDEAVNFALEILKNCQERWNFEREGYEGAYEEIESCPDTAKRWSTYFGECEISIFKKFI